MNFPWRISVSAALIFAVVSCGSKPESAPAATVPSQGSSLASTDAQVIGRIAPSLAPPATLVAFEPHAGVEVPVKTDPAVMDQVSLEFLPAFLLAQAGQKVEFRNSEDVLHNIRVTEVSEQKPVFNIATPPYGKFAYTFEQPGIYNVGCDIHSTMRADILVTATPYTVMTGSDGSFTMVNVKPGQYNVRVYTEKGPISRSVEVKSGRADLGVIQ